MEAGLGTVSRIAPWQIDLVLVVAEPTAKGIEVARRAAQIAAARARVIVVANRIREPGDLEAIEAALGEYELVPVPEEPAITQADRDGVAPIDLEPCAAGVRALTELASRVASAIAQPPATDRSCGP